MKNKEDVFDVLKVLLSNWNFSTGNGEVPVGLREEIISEPEWEPLSAPYIHIFLVHHLQL